MINVLFVLFGIAGLFCLYLTVACLLAASQENVLPDIEDVETG
jgi:hypothetical protein